MACFWETFVKKINRFQVSRIRDVVTFRPFKNKDVVTVYTCVSCDHQIFTYGKWFYHASHVSLALHFFFKYVSDFKWISYNIDSITGQSATSNEPQPTQKKNRQWIFANNQRPFLNYCFFILWNQLFKVLSKW